MDRARISDHAHADHPIAAPLGEDTAARLLALALAPEPRDDRGDRAARGRRVLDLGCGDGSWLLRALRHDPSLTAVGVDLSDEGFARMRTQADLEGLGTRLELVHGDARDGLGPEPCDPFDVVLCVGATYAFGGLGPAMSASAGHLAPGGRLLVGECFWEQPPSTGALDLLGAEPDDYATLGATVDVATSDGWRLLHGHVSSAAEWDDYEWSWVGALSRWVEEHPDHPDAAQVTAACDEHRRAWLHGYRGVLGFVSLLLARA